MNLSTAAIVGGYAVLAWQFGAWGVLAGVAHLALLMLFVRK